MIFFLSKTLNKTAYKYVSLLIYYLVNLKIMFNIQLQQEQQVGLNKRPFNVSYFFTKFIPRNNLNRGGKITESTQFLLLLAH